MCSVHAKQIRIGSSYEEWAIRIGSSYEEWVLKN